MDNERYRRSADAAAHIVNLYVNGSKKAVIYGKVLFTIMAVVEEAERDLCARLCKPSDN